MKAIQLENNAIPLFRERLRGSLGLGPYLEQHIAGGSLWVWAPEVSTPIDLGRLNEDIFYPASTDLESTLTNALLRHFKTDPSAVLVADTAYRLEHVRPDSLQWFSLDSFHDPGQRRICAFLTGAAADEKAVEELVAVASPYPTTLVFTSLTHAADLTRGVYLDPRNAVLQDLVQAVKHVLVGVFDERTMLIWSSAGALPLACLDVDAEGLHRRP
jgi:hypothetical protein